MIVRPYIGFYFAGLSDGEACFSIERNQQKSTTTYRCAFIIKMRADDTPLLASLRNDLGDLGTFTYTREGGNRRSQVRWTVANKADCLALVDLFAEYPLRSKKRLDFAIWSAAVEFWACVGGGATDWSEMEGYYHQIREVRAYRELGAPA